MWIKSKNEENDLESYLICSAMKSDFRETLILKESEKIFML